MAVWSTGSILRRLPQRSKDFRAAKSQARTRRHAKRPPRERLRSNGVFGNWTGAVRFGRHFSGNATYRVEHRL